MAVALVIDGWWPIVTDMLAAVLNICTQEEIDESMHGKELDISTQETLNESTHGRELAVGVTIPKQKG
jgi:hypothetical protein